MQKCQRKITRVMASRERGGTITQRLSKTRWKPPEAGLIKINVDGALFAEQRPFDAGAVAQDSLGEVLAAMVRKGQGLTEEIEACSLRKALQWAKNLMFNSIVVESDCAAIVTAIFGDPQSSIP
ncbi:hypothetical protein SLA2020_322740 [Shorea laevis]